MMHDPIDAYLAELIGEATAVELDTPLPAVDCLPSGEVPAAIDGVAEALSQPEKITTPADMPAVGGQEGPPAAARSDLWTAQLLDEMENDPQFGNAPEGPVVMDEAAPDAFPASMDTDIVSKPEIWTDLLLQELDADPQFVRATDVDLTAPPAAGCADEPAVWTQALMDELADDPLFADAMPSASQAAPAASAPTGCNEDLLREMEADPLFAQASPAPQQAPTASAAPAGNAAAAPVTSPPVPDTRPVPHPWLGTAHGGHPDDNRTVAASPPMSRWLRLRCGEQPYALELLKVQEVGLPVPLLSLRGTPAHMLGIMNLRGQVVPVMDLGVFLGGMPAEETPASRIVVLESDGHTLGLRVSSVEDVVSLGAAHIEPPDTVRLCRFSNHLFRGVARLGGPPMILLDADALLG